MILRIVTILTAIFSYVTFCAAQNEKMVIHLQDGREDVYSVDVVDSVTFIQSNYKYKNRSYNFMDAIWGSYRIIAHRGYSKSAPENTLAAFKMAKIKGFDTIETDIRFTSDGVPVCIHDNTIDRTSNGSGRVDSYTLTELKEYDFGSWKSTEYEGEEIPTLEEAMILCKRLNLKMYIELKECSSEEEAIAILDLVYKYDMQSFCTFIAFRVTVLYEIVKLDSNFRFGVLDSSGFESHEKKMSYAKRLQIPNLFVEHKYSSLTNDIIDYCIKNNYPLEVYSINNPQIAQGLDSYIGGFTTDELSPNDWFK